MTVFQLLGLLCLPVLAVWPVTATIVRYHRLADSSISPQKACYQAGLLVTFASLTWWIYISLKQPTTDSVETLAGVAYLLVYCFCCSSINWFIFAVTEASMHTHLLVEIGCNDGLTLTELHRRYNKSKIISVRISRLIEIGQLRLTGSNQLILGGRWVLVGAEIARLLRILLSIPPQPVQEEENGTRPLNPSQVIPP
jgi:hypothetical protein